MRRVGIGATDGSTAAVMAAGTSDEPESLEPSAFSIAEKAVKAADYDRAIALLQEVIAKDPDHYDALNYLGFSHRQRGDNETSLGYYKKVLAVKPDHRGANEYLGELYLKQGKLDLATRQLAILDQICPFGCEEFDDLKAAIKAYENGGGFSGFSKQPRSAD
jgi:tetratricopeptide (TPR) repeat protein